MIFLFSYQLLIIKFIYFLIIKIYYEKIRSFKIIINNRLFPLILIFIKNREINYFYILLQYFKQLVLILEINQLFFESFLLFFKP